MSDILLYHEEMEEMEETNRLEQSKKLIDNIEEKAEEMEEDTNPCNMFETVSHIRPDKNENPIEWEMMYAPLRIGERAYDEIEAFILETHEKYSGVVTLFDIQCILDCINEKLAGMDHARRKKQ